MEYYDGVVLTGLELAVEDLACGGVDRGCEIELTETMQSVIGDPSNQVDAKPGPTGTHLMSPATAPFDEAVTAILAQLLQARPRNTRG